jgi:hypothetical protein
MVLMKIIKFIKNLNFENVKRGRKINFENENKNLEH